MTGDEQVTDRPYPRGLSRRGLLFGGAAAAAILTIGGVSTEADAAGLSGTRRRMTTGRTFYVSSAGSDAADGLTTATAWKSPARVNGAITSGTLGVGDTVSFRCGDTFFGGLISNPVVGAAGEKLAFTSYGAGQKPRISGYKVCSDPAAWTAHSSGIWKIDLSANSGAYGGNIGSTNVNVGFLKVGGTIHGQKRWDIATLANEWDFYSDGTSYLYVASPSNPSGAGAVEVAVAGHLMQVGSATFVDGLEFVGTGSHGISIANQADGVMIQNNLVREIGGSGLSGTTRYGNGVQVWIGCRDVLITGNAVSQVYDVAVTFQGGQDGVLRGWSNVHATGNTIENCNQSFEMWSQGTDFGVGSGFVDCSFSGNTCRDAGYSWGAPVRPDQNGKGTHLLFYYTDLPTDLEITDNTFERALHNYCYFAFAPRADLVMDGNAISLQTGRKIEYQRSETIEQHADWVAVRGKEISSVFTIV